MKAIISGQAGIAVLAEGSHYWSVSVAEPDLRKTCAPESIHFLFAGADDVISVEASEGEVLTRLTTAWQMDRALQMTLILLDRDEDQDLREMAAECLEEFLANAEVSEFVVNRLHESPLPEDADINVAIDIATNLAFSSAAALLKEVQERQAVIQLVSHAFSDLDDQFFGAETFQSKTQARRWFSDRGVFRKLAKGHGPSIGNEVMRLLSNPEIASVPTATALILKWIAPLKSPAIEMDYTDIESEESKARSKTRSTKQSAKRASLSDRESKALVDRQLEEILTLIENSEETKALQWASDVFQRQVDAGDEPFGVKSMSNLAIQMKQRGRPDLHLRFATIAASSNFADAQALNQLADALLQSGDAVRALRQYDETIERFSNNFVARCGRAEVLRELGRFEDALQQYEQTIDQFSDNVVAQCGRAEVLRELGRFEDALQQYEQTIHLFSNDVVARNGRAEVLRELGRFEDALLQYDQNIDRFTNNVVAQCGRAEVLRELSRFEDSLQQYEQTMVRFSNDAVAQCGRAEALRELGRFEDALQQYEQTITRFSNNVVAQCGRAEVLRELGRFEDSLQQYKQTIDRLGSPKFVIRHDWIDFHVRGMVHLRRGDLERASEIFEYGASRCQFRQQVPYFKSAAALVRLRMKDAGGAIEAMRGETGPLSNIIRMHAYGEQSLHEECKMTYASLERQKNRQVVQIRSLLFEGYLSEKATVVRTAAWEEEVFFKELHLLLRNAA